MMGSKVCFKPYVYEAPFAPYYDDYKGHTFEVVEIHNDEEDEDIENFHVTLRCISDPRIIVKGNVHVEDLVVLDDVTDAELERALKVTCDRILSESVYLDPLANRILLQNLKKLYRR
jgi:hypothetical protein